MHPALSVIFFTVTSGIGYGLFMILALLGLWDETLITQRTGVPAGGIALILVTAGLLSSMFHLANPKNAWRALHRFRTSWLAREGAFAILFYFPATLYTALWWFNDNRSTDLWSVLSILVFAFAFVVVFCTGMIYACLKTIRQWHTPLVPTNYLLYSLLSGTVLLLLIKAYLVPRDLEILHWASIVLLGLALTTHLIYLYWTSKKEGPTINTATGFTRATVRLLDVGHTAPTFLTEEFGYVNTLSPRLANTLHWLCLLLAFVLPLLLLTFALDCMQSFWLYGGAFVSLVVGLAIERWLFFARANHVVNLYHGSQAV